MGNCKQAICLGLLILSLYAQVYKVWIFGKFDFPLAIVIVIWVWSLRQGSGGYLGYKASKIFGLLKLISFKVNLFGS